MDPTRDTELTRLTAAYPNSSFTSAATAYSPELVHTPSTPGTWKRESRDGLLHGNHEHDDPAETPSVAKTILIQIFAAAWLLPTVALLFLNIKKHIIGASAWCPFGKCHPEVYVWANEVFSVSDKAITLPAVHDRKSRNLVGSLQLAAKVLEVWFILIATWLVYLVTMFLASKRHGLPVGYLTRPSQFANLPSVFDPLLWTTLRRMRTARAFRRKARKRIYLYVVATLILCAICNLMGPSIAVLLLPSLQWITTPRYDLRQFGGLNSRKPPGPSPDLMSDADFRASSCTSSEFADSNYTCASSWKTSLDGWTGAYLSTQNVEYAVSVQNLTSFVYNMSVVPVMDTNNIHEHITWVPCRQTLRELNKDLDKVMSLSAGLSIDNNSLASYLQLNNTVQTTIRRNGPILGAVTNVWSGYDRKKSWTITVDRNKFVRCYSFYDVAKTPMCWNGTCSKGLVTMPTGNYTRCIQTGAGWENGFANASFQINGYWRREDVRSPNITVSVHSSPKVAFLRDGIVSEDLQRAGFDQACLGKSPPPNCDWSALFDSSLHGDLSSRSRNITTWDMEQNPKNVDNHPNFSALSIDFTVYQSFANYSLDPSQITNPLLVADFDIDFSRGMTLQDNLTVAIAPAWSLAAWSAGQDAQVSGNRVASRGLHNIFDDLWEQSSYEDSEPLSLVNKYHLNAYTFIPVIQMLSLIDYNTTDVASGSPTRSGYPILRRDARIFVWAYGIQSRTSYLGATVAAIGCLVVVAEVFIGLFIDRRRFRSPTQLLVAALEHQYANEFDGNSQGEKQISRVSFQLHSDDSFAGRFKFVKVS